MRMCARYVILALVMLWYSPACAQEGQGKRITIIDGKKFFSLRDARRFSGQRKPMPVTPPPVQQGRLPPSYNRRPSVPAAASATETTHKDDKAVPPPSAPDAPVSPQHSPASSDTASKVLSIFAPEGKGTKP